MSTGGRRALGGVLGLVPMAIVLGTAAAWWSRLPAQMPTHWSGVAEPDGFTSRSGTLALTLAFAVVGAVVCAAAAWWHPRNPSLARGVAALGASVAGLFATTWLVSSLAVLVVPSAETAILGWRLALLPAGVAWGVIGLLLPGGASAAQRRTADERDAHAAPAPHRAIRPGERVSWSVVLVPRWLIALAVGALVVLVVVAFFVPATIPAVVPVAVVAVVFSRIEITVDRRGLRVVAGLVRVPIKRIPLEQVDQARAEDIRPADWGGWGYRVAPGRSALVLRAGPALVVEQRDGRRFAATVDDPEPAAALLNGLAARL